MFAKVFLALALAGSALAQTFSINTPPSIQQCQVAQLSWVGGTAPFTLDVIPATQVTAPAIADIATGVSASPYAWTVNVASGTAITIRIRDSLGNIAYSSPLTVQTGTSSSCLTGGSSSSAVSASGSASSAVGTSGSASAAPTTARPSSSGVPSASQTSARSSSTTPVASSSSAAAASSSGAAGKLAVEGSALMGALGAILALI